jgi:hypothetical protein
MGRASGKRNIPREPTVGGEPGSGKGREIGQSVLQDPSGSPIPGLTGNIVNYETTRQKVPVPEPRDEYEGILAHGVPNSSQTTEERATMVRDGTLAQFDPAAPPRMVKIPVVPEPIPVYVTNPAGGGRAITSMAGQRISIPAQGTAATRITARDESRQELYLMVETATASLTLTPPTVPATTVPAQNGNSYPVTVVISANGATITAVTVNGVVVGNAAGTYVVPPYGSISITYTVATPTWTWTGTTTPLGVRISHEVGDLDIGQGALLRVNPGWQKMDGCQDELFAVSADANPVILTEVFLFEVPAGG